MNEIIIRLLSNSFILTLFTGTVSIIILIIVGFYIIAFIQGRNISFWPPRIGELPMSTLPKGKTNETQIFAINNFVKTYDNRKILDSEYENRKYLARRVDILSIALSVCLDELAADSNNKMLHRVLFNSAEVRLIFLDPNSLYMPQRAIEDTVGEEELREILRRSVKNCVFIYERLQSLYEKAKLDNKLRKGKVGRFEIRLMDLCPHMTIYRTDDVALMGIYSFAGHGMDSPVLEVKREHRVLFDDLSKHFDKIWNHKLSYIGIENYLIRYYEPSKPMLNEKLFEKVLGPDWQRETLSQNAMA